MLYYNGINESVPSLKLHYNIMCHVNTLLHSTYEITYTLLQFFLTASVKENRILITTQGNVTVSLFGYAFMFPASWNSHNKSFPFS